MTALTRRTPTTTGHLIVRSSLYFYSLMVVPYDTLKAGDKIMVLPGATRDSLKTLPEFNYAK